MDYSYCRPEKARNLEESTTQFEKREKLSVLRIEQALILPVMHCPNLLFGNGGVVDAQNDYIQMSAIEGRIEGAYPVQNEPFEDKQVVYCGYLVNHWGHFLIEGIARLWYCLSDPKEVDWYVFTSDIGGETEAKANYLAFFQLLGIADKLKIINQPVRYRSVIIPERAYGYRHYYSEQYKEIFERVVANALTKKEQYTTSEKVFFSRSRFQKARKYEAGLDMLDDYFKRNGYEIIYPEQLSLEEMICKIRSAKWCASESGSTPHNMLFAADGQKLIVIERQSVINHVQSEIDKLKALDVIYIDGHFTVYPVPAGGGPFFLAYNDLFRQFTKDMNYCDPDSRFTSEAYIRKCVKQYMKAYRKDFGELLGLENWQISYIGAIYEAYVDSCKVLRPYLSGERPYRLGQCFNLHFIGHLLRRRK